MITAGLSEEIERRITEAIRTPPINSSKRHSDYYYCSIDDVIMTLSDIASVSAIKEQLPAEVHYWHIKMTISILQVSTNYIKPGSSNKLPSNTNSIKQQSRDNSSERFKRHLPTWSVKKSSKRSKRFF